MTIFESCIFEIMPIVVCDNWDVMYCRFLFLSSCKIPLEVAWTRRKNSNPKTHYSLLRTSRNVEEKPLVGLRRETEEWGEVQQAQRKGGGGGERGVREKQRSFASGAENLTQLTLLPNQTFRQL